MRRSATKLTLFFAKSRANSGEQSVRTHIRYTPRPQSRTRPFQHSIDTIPHAVFDPRRGLFAKRRTHHDFITSRRVRPSFALVYLDFANRRRVRLSSALFHLNFTRRRAVSSPTSISYAPPTPTLTSYSSPRGCRSPSHCCPSPFHSHSPIPPTPYSVPLTHSVPLAHSSSYLPSTYHCRCCLPLVGSR